MNEGMEITDRFYNFIEDIGITYDKNTGWLSETINFVIYKNRSFYPVKRVFIVGEQFVVFNEDSIRRFKFNNVVGFNLLKNG